LLIDSLLTPIEEAEVIHI